MAAVIASAFFLLQAAGDTAKPSDFNWNGVWTLGAGIAAAIAAIYATASARRTARGAQVLEREKQEREQDRLDREATDRKQTDLREECDRCVQQLADARKELVEAYKLIGQYQERERLRNEADERRRK